MYRAFFSKHLILAYFCSLIFTGIPSFCFAAGFGQDAFGNLALLQSGALTKPMVKAVGLALDNRPYEPATPLGIKIGLDLGIEVALVRVPDDFKDAMTQAGNDSGASLPFLPAVRLVIHKGLGDRVDIGGSFLALLDKVMPALKDYRILGADIKLVIFNPTEGPTWALRLCYSSATLGIIDTKTWTPQLLISRKLDFADPYLGVGYQYVSGTLNLIIPAGPINIPYSDTATATAVTGFLGVAFRFPPLGLKLTLEGTANSGGTNVIGTKISFAI